MGTHENNFSKQEINQDTQSGLKGTLPQEGKCKQPKDKENLGTVNVKPLEFFMNWIK